MNLWKHDNTTHPKRPSHRRRGAFTLVELMVVMAVLAIIIGMTIAVTSRAVDDAKARQTRAILMNLQTAVEQFKLDAPLKRMKNFNDRYRGFPPDELGAFVKDSIKTKSGMWRRIGPGGASRLALPSSVTDPSLVKFSAIKAMTLAIRLFSPEGAAALDQIGANYRKPPDDQNEFFDRNNDNSLDTYDEPLVYFVDAWGTPIDYFATNPVPGSNADEPPTATAARDRFETAKFMVAKNLGKPVLASCGPDGADQCPTRFNQSENLMDLVADYDSAGPRPHVIDNPLNGDNVYIDEGLRDRLKTPLPSDKR